MDSLDRWQTQNEEYLQAALAWLRLKLARLAEPVAAGMPVQPVPRAMPVTVAAPGLFSFSEQRDEASAGEPAPEPPRPMPAVDDLAAARRRLDGAVDVQPPPALVILGQRLGMSDFELETLLLCAAMELDTRIAGLCARAQGDANRPFPTFALALSLFDEPAWDVLSPERPLRHWRLIEINQPGALPLVASTLRADERIVNYLKGLNYLDDRLAPLLVPFDAVPGDEGLPVSQQQAVDQAATYIEHSLGNGQPPVVQLLGMDPLSKQLVAWQAAQELGLQIYRITADLLPVQAGELETLARLWQRESVLLPIALYLDAHESDNKAASEGQAPPVQRFLARSGGIFFLGVREIRAGLLGAMTTAVEVDKPLPSEQQAAWRAVLGEDAGSSPARLAGQFHLNVPTITQIAHTAIQNGEDDRAAVWRACLLSTRPRMDLLAQRLDPKATWDDIVLPADVSELLHQIGAQVAQRSTVYDDWGFRARMNRGLGINALFAGESGTGKTMAAEVLANDLQLNLYRIDLSQVVSKYIGETEKNLRRLFDAAEDGGAILFFDEADALFGKRSEVKDSHDRYANIEINYLLQRMEEYRGLAILATNMKSALDQAFLRRLRFVVNFPFPGPADRARIWRRVFPDDVPRDELDFARLSRLNVAGGSIHNIALNAAFLAARAGSQVTMPLVLRAAEIEFRKLERPIQEADFRWEAPAGAAP